MKVFYKIIAALMFPSVLLLFSYVGGSPGGKTGSPGDENNTCTNCHSGTAQEESGWISTDIPADGYVPGETYTVTATGMHDGVVKFGFELTAENEAGDKLGGLILTDASRTKFTNSENAITHTSNGTSPDGNTNTWSMDWKAPDNGDGTAVFYAAFNAANGNGNTLGDQIYKTSLTVNEFVPVPAVAFVDPDHGEQGSEMMLTVTGENTHWTSGIFSVRFVNHTNPDIKFLATNVDVKNDTELTCDIAIAEELEIGTYDVFVDAAMLAEGFTVDIASGIEKPLFASLVSAYPNPASEYFMLNLPEGSQYRIVDLTGRVILEMRNGVSEQKIDVSSFEKGFYLVQVVNDTESMALRLIKN